MTSTVIPDTFQVTVNLTDDTSDTYTVSKFPWEWRVYTVFAVVGSDSLVYVPTRNIASMDVAGLQH